ncbi:hypothetical protein BDN72DRAFT_958848 [Pluteus cervinus]|uniref:Uncharacterized protein n=1 Tax=Pluteus cervinus TaxID=181527 RepID=A0ACD3AYF7_9AGAR|nr:hypothetical protein BDN72DRAFT_958848 [Pluteus cervinus]
MGIIEDVLGTLLVGIFINTYMYGVVSHQYVTYFSLCFQDNWRVKSTVCAVFLLDTTQSISIIYMAWYYCIENFSNEIALIHSLWPYPFAAITTCLTAFLTQSFMTHRIYRFTGNTFLCLVISLLVVASLGAGLATGISSWMVKSALELPRVRPTVLTWLCIQVATDCMIAIVLIFILSKSRTGFSKSDTVVNRLIRATIQTGFLTSICAILALAFFVTSPLKNTYAIVGMPMGRIYSLTLMDTLLSRESLRNIIATGPGHSKQDRESSWVNSATLSGTSNNIQMHIQKEVFVESVVVEEGPGSPRKFDSKYHSKSMIGIAE